MDMGMSKRRLPHTHTHTHSGVGGRQDVCLQTIAICKQTLKPTSWISNAVGERVGGKGRTRTSLGTCICLDPEPHGRFETGVTERASTHTLRDCQIWARK